MLSHLLGCELVVPRNHAHLQVQLVLEVVHHELGLGLAEVLLVEREDELGHAVNGEHHHRHALLLNEPDLSLSLGIVSKHAKSLHQLQVSALDPDELVTAPVLNVDADTLAVDVLEVGEVVLLVETLLAQVGDLLPDFVADGLANGVLAVHLGQVDHLVQHLVVLLRLFEVEAVLAVDDLVHEHVARGEGARLVEDDGVNILYLLQDVCALDQDSVGGGHSGADHDGGGSCEAQGAGASDDEGGDAEVEGELEALHVLAAGQDALVAVRVDHDEPDDPVQDGEGHDRGHEVGGNLVGHALDRRLRVLSILDQLHDLVEGRVLRSLGHLDDDGALGKHRSTEDADPDVFLDRKRLSGEHRLIATPPAEDDDAVRGHLAAWLHEHKVVLLEQLDLDDLDLAVEVELVQVPLLDQVGLSHLERGQLRQLLHGLHLGVGLDQFADLHNGDDDRGRLEVVSVAVDLRVEGVHVVVFAVAEDEEDGAVEPGGSGADHDEHVHIGALVLQTLEGALEEADADVEEVDGGDGEEHEQVGGVPVPEDVAQHQRHQLIVVGHDPDEEGHGQVEQQAHLHLLLVLADLRPHDVSDVHLARLLLHLCLEAQVLDLGDDVPLLDDPGVVGDHSLVGEEADVDARNADHGGLIGAAAHEVALDGARAGGAGHTGNYEDLAFDLILLVHVAAVGPEGLEGVVLVHFPL
mmetsp:Transcript_1220/g.2226  ORF Transcript_1220/g.2226 Transcript_1220/m.2226 type:complete len:693 (-) Transcript_1220:470-2548(-)